MLKKLLLTISILMSGLAIAAPQIAMAADNPAKTPIQQGACEAAGQTDCNPAESTTNIDKTIRKVVNLLSVLTGVIAVIMIIIGGFRYVTSGGASDKVTGAKNTILYAIIGLIIVALAQIIVRFVLTNTTTNSSGNTSQSGGSNLPSSGNRVPQYKTRVG